MGNWGCGSAVIHSLRVRRVASSGKKKKKTGGEQWVSGFVRTATELHGAAKGNRLC